MTSEIFAIATFWFGGPWLSARIFDAMKWDKNLLAYYIASLAVFFTAFLTYPLYRWVTRVGEDLGRRDEEKHV